MRDLRGQQLGKYTLLEEIGSGAMGVVYKGYDHSLERAVAVKILAPHLAWEAETVERFMREARTAARLNHPNIVTIHDVGQQDECYYFVMEYLEGTTLRDYVRQNGPLPAGEAMAILQQLASALDYAHRAGVVHRDVKPANVIVSAEGRATLTDFGIVKAVDETKLTATGTTLGTPEYMAPEQASQGQVTAAADLYALGVIAYEMLSGQVPFSAPSTMALLYRIVHDPLPPITWHRPDLPQTSEAVFSRALNKDPQGRYESGAALVSALGQVLTGQEYKAPQVPLRVRGPAERTMRMGATPGTPTRPKLGSVPVWAWAVGGGGLLLIGIIAVIAAVLLSGDRSSRPQVMVVTTFPTPPSRTPTAPDTRPTEAPTALPEATRAPTETPRPTRTPTPGARVANDTANLRAGPGTVYARIGRLTLGDMVRVIAWAQGTDGDRWLLVEAPGVGTGWLSASLMQENEGAALVPRAETVPPTPIPATRAPTAVPTPAQRTVSLYIYAWKEWQNTGLYVNKGELIQVKASGRWDIDDAKNCPGMYGPDGCNYSTPSLILPGANAAALVARVTGGNLVLVGSSRSWRADASGNLQMITNDAPGWFLDNDGELWVTITVSR